MKKFKIIIILSLCVLLYFPIIFLYALSGKQDIDKDVICWSRNYDISFSLKHFSFIYLFYKFKEFRNLFYYRVKKRKNILTRLLLIVSKVFIRELSTLYITCNKIGGGLFIQHGFSTIISADSIGENCWINQNVTIGFDEKLKSPVIGDNVRISTGAIVLGGINIGDNSIIGPNSLVVRSIPANSTVVSQPSYIVKKDNKWVMHKLESYNE